jgi:hypothetical protein
LNYCDDEDMPVICPTCQISWSDRFIRRRFYSNPWTGGSAALLAGSGEVLTDGGELVAAAACC